MYACLRGLHVSRKVAAWTSLATGAGVGVAWEAVQAKHGAKWSWTDLAADGIGLALGGLAIAVIR
jgi:hypothetical protein